MDFSCSGIVKYPIDMVWTNMRDHLADIVIQQPDIAEVNIDLRAKNKPNKVHIVSTWRADPPLPSFLKSFIKPEMLIWTDDSHWDNDTYVNHFSINTHYKVEDITCIGTIALQPHARGKHTKVTFSGIFTIAKTKKSSIFLTGFVIKGIETIAGQLIESNFSKVIKTVNDSLSA